MRVFRCVAPLALLLIAGCAGYPDRREALAQLNPAPMSARDWAHLAGTYTGPIRASTLRGGYEGYSSIEARLDLAGPVYAPEVSLKMDSGFSTAWAMYGERKGVYTNIPSKRYGSQGVLYVSTHAPTQLLLETRRFGAATGTGLYLIISFQPDGAADVDLIGHSGWHGDGELWRVPDLMRAM